MTPYVKDGKPGFMLTIKAPDGRFVQRSAGTTDKARARDTEALLRSFGKKQTRDWGLLSAVVDRRVTAADLYEMHLRGELDLLRARLNDVDLRPGIAAWELRIADEIADVTARHYRQQVAKLFPNDAPEGESATPVWCSGVTGPWLKAQLAKVKGSASNRQRYGAGWRSLFKDIVEQGLMDANPMDAVTLPPANRVGEKHLAWPDALRLIELMEPGQHRALCALRHGAGIEASAALRTTRSDVVNTDDRIVWAHGTKDKRRSAHANRDRQVILEAACWGVFWSWLQRQAFLPHARLFTVTARQHQEAQDDAYAMLRNGRDDLPTKYVLHSARNTYAVHGMTEGWELTLLASNLGHATTALLQTKYGRYRPRITELVRSAKRAEQGKETKKSG